MAVTEPRPDLAAHTRSVRASFPEVATELRNTLGARLVAYLGSVAETGRCINGPTAPASRAMTPSRARASHSRSR